MDDLALTVRMILEMCPWNMKTLLSFYHPLSWWVSWLYLRCRSSTSRWEWVPYPISTSPFHLIIKHESGLSCLVAIDPSLMLHMLMLVLRENYCLEWTHRLELSQLLLRHCVPPKGIASGTAVPAAHRAITVQTALILCSLMVEQTIKWAQSRSVPLCLWEFPEDSSRDCTSSTSKTSNAMKFSLLSFICSLIQTQINVVYFDLVS